MNPVTTEAASAPLYRALDAITKPTTRQVARDADAAWLQQLADDPEVRFCDVQAYRAATALNGTVPSLWVQAQMTLTTSETSEGAASLKATRSPADLALMETMLSFQEQIGYEWNRGLHQACGLPWRATFPERLRALMTHIAGHHPADVDLWAYKVAQWARLLENYLRAGELQPKPVRIRGFACPECNVKQARVKSPDGSEWQLVPPIMIDFRDKYVRAAQCSECGATWFRGEQLEALAAYATRTELETA